MRSSSTHYMLTWGMEGYGIYRLDTQQKLSYNYFNNLPNAKVFIHANGHVYPKDEVLHFLAN
ncbi:MAG: hypothetical protein ACI8VT_000053 [Saprospiraceae bacterium]|jgi:hypothetical protein